MSVTATRNINPLAIYSDRKYQNHRKSYAYGDVFKFVTELGKISPFQLPVTSISSLSDIDKFDIIKFSDLSETSVLSQLSANGFSVQSSTDYNLVVNPGSLAFTGTWEPTQYFWRMQAGSDVWESDVFLMSNDVSGCLKLEWWHNEDFVYSDGHIQYNYPYKNFVYLNTQPGKPKYPKLKEVSIRDGKEFDLKVTTWKEYRFEIKAAEYLLDALSFVCQHDSVVITYDEQVWNVEKFEVDDNWQQRGDISMTEAVFTTDTHTTVNGRAYNSLTYEAASCGCLTTQTITAKAVLTTYGVAYSGYYYLDTDGVTQIPLQAGDYILAQDYSGNNQLQTFNGHGYTGYTPPGSTFPAVCIEDTQEYFFENGYYYIHTTIDSATSTGVDTWNLQGKTFDSVNVEIWTKVSGGSPVLITTGTAADFNGSGIEFTSASAVAVQVRPATLNCSDFDNSEWFLLGTSGIGWMTINTTFTVT